MTKRGLRLGIVAIACALALYFSSADWLDAAARADQQPSAGQQSPQPQQEKLAEQVYKNIQVFKGVPAARLMPGMARIAQFLGVDCAHCHVPNEFEKDDKPAKQTARKMFQMVRTISSTLNTNSVTCYTCHRAQAKPAPPPAEWMPTEQEREQAAQDKRPVEQVYKNIQTLKGVLPAGRLPMVMKMFTRALGVDCTHCHVPGEFEKDDKPAKQTARQMLRLTGVIAREHYGGNSPINCYTCHRGQVKPLSMPPANQPPVNQPPAEPAKPEIKSSAALPSVEQILDKYLQALGGGAQLARVTTRVMKGSLVTPGRTAPLEVWGKAPNKSFTTFRPPADLTLMGFNGVTGWRQTAGGSVQEVGGDELALIKFEAEFHKELKLRERYPKLKVLGTARLGERETYAVEAMAAGREPETWYFDAQSGLLLRLDLVMTNPQGKMALQVFYEDYRAVDGIKLPFAIRRARPGFTWTYKFDEIKLNVPVDDAKFDKPTRQ